MWGSVDGDQIFSLFFVGGLLIGDSDRYKCMNKTTVSEDEASLSIATLLENMGEGLIYGGGL
jgi:hypothetical protein